MKDQADKKRSVRSFQVGDQVFLKVQPYLQNSLAARRNQKLALKFYGPYQVPQRVGAVSYKLALPANSRIHDVIHVSQLKKQVPSKFSVEPDMSTVAPRNLSLLQPATLLQMKLIQRGG